MVCWADGKVAYSVGVQMGYISGNLGVDKRDSKNPMLLSIAGYGANNFDISRIVNNSATFANKFYTTR